MNPPHSSSRDRGVALIKGYVKTLSFSSGVYRMFGIKDEVLYVGKAKNLKKRVANYTQPDRLPLRLQRMITETHRMEFVATPTEADALLLEANLIKKLSPRYNILMRDSKSFAFIRLTLDHPFPLLTKHRGARTSSGEYYGPFASTEAVNTTLTILHRAFLLRSCPDTVFSSRKRPCLQYQIKRCSAPCVGYISSQDYSTLVKETRDFLKGKTNKLQKKLALQMEAASQVRDYEKASLYRDRIRALTTIQAHQVINTAVIEDADVFAIYAAGGKTCIQFFLFRNGSNYGTSAAFPTHGEDVTTEEVLEAYLLQFYQDTLPPPEIFINIPLTEKKLLEEALSKKSSSRKIRISLPRLGKKADLVQHAYENAKASFDRHQADKTSHTNLLISFMDVFKLSTPPKRIEVYDNSHIQGTYPVGAMIVAGQEGFIKNAYRKFNIRSTDLAPGDDYGMLREVLTRRFAKALAHDKDDTTQWPDVVLIDGGKGQLSTALETFADLGVTDIHLIAIAKGPERNAGRETFFVPNREPFQLPPGHKVLYFLERLRDEAHRFAIGAHRTRRLKAISASRLDEIPGVGAARKRALLRYFGSARAVEGTGLKDLEAVEGISKSLAKKIYDYFHGRE